MRRSTSRVLTQTARMHYGMPVLALRAPDQAVTPHHTTSRPRAAREAATGPYSGVVTERARIAAALTF